LVKIHYKAPTRALFFALHFGQPETTLPDGRSALRLKWLSTNFGTKTDSGIFPPLT